MGFDYLCTMPVLSTGFAPPWSLRNGHFQTILPTLVNRSFSLEPQRQRLELKDGDFLDLDWYRTKAQKERRLAILTHGLEGTSRQDYVLGMADALQTAGWDVLAWNFRGCSGELNRLPRFYHSGETEDLHQVVQHAIGQEAYEHVTLVGFSLGGNITLKYVAEHPEVKELGAAVAISTPVDLVGSAQILDSRKSNRIYLRRFLKTLIQKVKHKAERFPEAFDLKGVDKMTTFSEFDNQFTAPLHGFKDAMDYWTQSSSISKLDQLKKPSLLLNAANDPFFDDSCLPFEKAMHSEHFYFECPKSGGHVGFYNHWMDRWRYSEQRALQFLEYQWQAQTLN